MYPWLLSQQAASAQAHLFPPSSPGSSPGRSNILPLLPGLLRPVSYSAALAGKAASALGSSCTSPGQLPRLRPLYQYINFDMPELMHPSAEEDEVPGLAQPSQVPVAPGRATAPQLEGELQQGLPSSCIPQGVCLVLLATKKRDGPHISFPQKQRLCLCRFCHLILFLPPLPLAFRGAAWMSLGHHLQQLCPSVFS